MRYLKVFEKFNDTTIDLSIELENKYRKGLDFDEDEFLSSLGVSDDEIQSITFWTSLELGREKYMNMSDEEFSKAYDEYISSKNKIK